LTALVPGPTPDDLRRAVALLESGGHTCVLCCGAAVLASDAHGVAPLLGWLADGVELAGFAAADRVVGRAAALLYARAGVTRVHAVLASEPGLAVLAAHGIQADAERVVPAILNRPRTASCPMEAAVADIDDPHAAEPALRAAVTAMQRA